MEDLRNQILKIHDFSDEEFLNKGLARVKLNSFKAKDHLLVSGKNCTSLHFSLRLLTSTIMRSILSLSLFILLSSSIMAQSGKATTTKTTFSRTTTISIDIMSTSEVIWSLLTKAENYPSWNSTVINIEGEIKEGEKFKLTSTLDTDRSFKLKVKDVEPNAKMTWKGSMGKRHFVISKVKRGVHVSMTEKIGGLMFPLFAKQIPDFDENFETFMSDLKSAAEER